MAAKNTSKTDETVPETKAETAPETAPEVAAETKKEIKRPRVEMVLTSVAEIAAEVSEDPEDFTGKRKSNTIDDELQKAFVGYVQTSWESEKKLTLVVMEKAERETVKRLRLAAASLGLGMAIGNVRPDKNVAGKVRIPYQTVKRRKYKKTAGGK
jgi:cobalamin biosynthesis protein CobT